MRIHSRQTFVLFLIILTLPILACGTLGSTDTVNEIDRDAIIADAVATIDARPSVDPIVQTSPSTAGTVLSGDLQDKLIELYNQLNPSVVHIITEVGTGTGFIFDNEGHVVTNNHVIAGSSRFEVVFYDGVRRSATVIGTDVDSDLAVMLVDDMPTNLPAVTLGNSSSVAVGQFVIAIGNPFDQQSSMSFGIVSGLGRSLRSQRGIEGQGFYSLPQVIQTDAPINPGNSGGPLLNLAGEVVGVNSAISTETGVNSGVGFSIPVNAVHRIIPALITDGSYTYPFMGVQITSLTLALQDRFGLTDTRGALVTAVTEGQPAAEAGIISNDIIREINGSPILNSDGLISFLVFETEVGQVVDVLLIRDGEEMIIPMTLGARP